MSPVAGVDLGKTGCRATTEDEHGNGRRPPVQGPGAPGLAESNGLERAVDAVWTTLVRTLPDPRVLTALGVGAAGAEAAPETATQLARELSSRLPQATVAVTSDSLAAHAGALGGRPGTVLAAGTGSVAVGLGSDGQLRQVDGWGPWLGDEGSGAWIGRQGLRAVLRHLDGRGPGTELSGLAVRRFGELTLLPRTICADGDVARTAASFAPDVLAAAEGGDRAALEIVLAACASWAEIVAAAAAAAATASDDAAPVSVIGGLASSTLLIAAFSELLPATCHVVAAQGTALDGALLLASRADLPHESRVVRVRPGTTGRDAVVATCGADVDLLATEQVRRDLDDLDDLDSRELVGILLSAEASVASAVTAAVEEIAEAVTLAGDALDAGGRLVYVGAGTPGRLATLDAAECPPTFGTRPDQVVAVVAGGGLAVARAVEGAEDDEAVGARDVLALDLAARDLVVGISASGRTPYVLAALEAARSVGCRTVAVVNNAGTPVAAGADVAIELLTGAEVIAGSTRLKAGTAQKVTLNALSTGAMVRHGKTYGAWMVDVVASNEKLRRRARRILREATGADDDRATAVLEAAGWHTKTALVALVADVDVRAAAALLDARRGRVRAALQLSSAGREEPG